jgi:hypothetical protein
MANKNATAITGAAGAYFVVAELSQLGWAASPTWGNAPRTDVLAQKADGSRVAAIQVKTRRSGSFQIGEKAEKPSTAANEWFVLVALNGAGVRPDFYVLPRDHITALVYYGYRAWLDRPGRNGRKHNETSMRAIKIDEITDYQERWDLLDANTSKAPWMLPEWVWSEAKKHPPPARGFKLGRRIASSR